MNPSYNDYVTYERSKFEEEIDKLIFNKEVSRTHSMYRGTLDSNNEDYIESTKKRLLKIIAEELGFSLIESKAVNIDWEFNDNHHYGSKEIKLTAKIGITPDANRLKELLNEFKDDVISAYEED